MSDTGRTSTVVIDVVAAVRMSGERYWVCRRTNDGSNAGLAGMWEYPGGKVEAGESLVDALKREMEEEFGVLCVVGRLLDVIETAVAGKRYRVHFFAVEFIGPPTLRVHDDTAWCTPEELVVQNHLPSGRVFNHRLLYRTQGLVCEAPDLDYVVSVRDRWVDLCRKAQAQRPGEESADWEALADWLSRVTFYHDG